MSAANECPPAPVCSFFPRNEHASPPPPPSVLWREQECYLYTLRAASKWGRWDVIESLMKDMRALGVGVVAEEKPYAINSGVVVNNGEGKGGGGEQHRPRMLSSDCYAPLVEAYAQASMWERAIEAYQEGFVVGREGGEAGPVKYRVRLLRRLEGWVFLLWSCIFSG